MGNGPHCDGLDDRRPRADAKATDFANFRDAETGKECLTSATRAHLWLTAVMMDDDLGKEMTWAREHDKLPWDVEAPDYLAHLTIGGDYLPRSHLHRYTWATVQNFLASYNAVVYKLGVGPLGDTMLSNTMEEFAMRALLERAKVELEIQIDMAREAEVGETGPGYDPSEVDLDPVFDLAFMDGDHDLLFDSSLDGIEDDDDMTAQLHPANLKMADWLTPFNSAQDSGHPFTWGHPPRRSGGSTWRR